jgi:CBS domain-containing protein/anti-sigma regulatory factor (Ser/Thr protein kinase)
MDDLFEEEEAPEVLLAKSLTRVDELAYDLRVREVMCDQVKAVTPDMTMQDVLNLLRQEHISGAPVVVDDQLLGVISLEDLIRSMTDNDLEAKVSKYMSTQVIAVNGYDAVIEAVKAFTRYKVGRLPVLNRNGKLVGMITKGDITRGVLGALQQGYHKEEIQKYRASHLFEDIISDRTSLILRYRIQPHDFIHGGTASSLIKRTLLRLGANPQIARRCGIAVYEAEMNLIIHATNGGLIRLEIEPHRILIHAIDDGPGIPDIQLAMQPGYSTASEKIREMGFGAGMGLVNMQRCVDKMSLRSSPELGTKLEMKIYLQYEESLKEPSQSSAEETDQK